MVNQYPSTLDLPALDRQIVSLFDNGLAIYTNFVDRLAAAKITLKETDAKLEQIDAKPAVTVQEKIFGVDKNIAIVGAISVAVIVAVMIYRSK